MEEIIDNNWLTVYLTDIKQNNMKKRNTERKREKERKSEERK